MLPSGNVTVMSSSRRSVCSAVTITPGRQKTPLEENRGRACIATTCFEAASTAPASSCESAANSFAIESSLLLQDAPAKPHEHIGRTGRSVLRPPAIRICNRLGASSPGTIPQFPPSDIRGDCCVRDRLALGFQIASLALTGWFLWGARLWSHRAPISVFDVLVRSTTYALVAFAAGSVITARSLHGERSAMGARRCAALHPAHFAGGHLVCPVRDSVHCPFASRNRGRRGPGDQRYPSAFPRVAPGPPASPRGPAALRSLFTLAVSAAAFLARSCARPPGIAQLPDCGCGAGIAQTTAGRHGVRDEPGDRHGLRRQSPHAAESRAGEPAAFDRWGCC